MLKVLNCESNKLTTLNLKNGNNKNFQTPPTSFRNNLYLTCIQVDDTTYSETNWFNLKDSTAKYNAICQNLSTADIAIDKSTIYPNPTKGQLYINNLILEKITVNNMEGKTVKIISFNYPSANNTIDLSDLIKGVYILKIKSNGIISSQKIIIE
ncbi:T9SS type A sorting domain-containing protein [Flavobacterium sp. LS2R12]|uniref:T9SS type A sorting domain-containing protein n=1 Tax=unclassified Flavobacterium TaxID=196869 RepID=UPI003AAE738D